MQTNRHDSVISEEPQILSDVQRVLVVIGSVILGLFAQESLLVGSETQNVLLHDKRRSYQQCFS